MGLELNSVVLPLYLNSRDEERTGEQTSLENNLESAICFGCTLHTHSRFDKGLPWCPLCGR